MGGYIALHVILRHTRQTKSRERGVQTQSNVIENELSLHMHIDLAPVLLEFPRIEPPVGRQSKVDAVVSR